MVVVALLALIAAGACSGDDAAESTSANEPTSSEIPTTATDITDPESAGGDLTTQLDLVDCDVQPDQLPEPNEVEITTDDTYRYVTSNAIPDHPVGEFPNSGNPNSIAAIDQEFRMLLLPEGAGEALDLGEFGVAVNGVVFDPGAAEYWNNDPDSGWQYEALGGGVMLGLDCNLAHVQPSGKYHYHGIPQGLLDNLGVDGSTMTLIGYAADGYPVYVLYGYADANDPDSEVVELESSYELKSGTRPEAPDGPGGTYDGTFVQDWEYVDGAGALDECNGREGVTPEYPDGTYAYFLTNTFPFIPRCYVATPDESFALGPGGGGPPPAGP